MQDYAEEQRLTYSELRAMAMESAYKHCQSVIVGSNHGYVEKDIKIDIFGRFFDETYECFDDVEELMYRTLELIFYHGVGPAVARNLCTRIINDILARRPFNELAKEFSPEEEKELRYDLQLLKFID